MGNTASCTNIRFGSKADTTLPMSLIELTNEQVNIEDFALVQLDNPSEMLNKHITVRTARLRNIIHCIKNFQNSDACINYIQSVKREKIFFIVSGTLGKRVLPVIHDLNQIAFVYIFCENRPAHENWSRRYSKIRGIFVEEVSLLAKMNDDVMAYMKNITPVSIFDIRKQKSVKQLDKENVNFVWTQILLEYLIRMPRTDIDKSDMLEECRKYYKYNPKEIEKINEFEQDYDSELAIWWYTRDCFAFRLLNKALRIENIDMLYKLRFFITDVYNKLTELHSDFIQANREDFCNLIVYRGQSIATDEFQTIQAAVGNIISINTFLSTTTDKEVAIIYAGNGLERPILESVIFEINVDMAIEESKPYANIQHMSYFHDENEILFCLGTSFRIINVDKLPENQNINYVKLELCTQQTQQVRKLKEEIIGTLGKDYSLSTFADVLNEMGYYDKSEVYYKIELERVIQTNDNAARSELEITLSELAKNKGDLLASFDYLNGVLARTSPTDYILLEKIHQHLGHTWHNKGDYEQALTEYKKALNIAEQHLSTNAVTYADTQIYIGRVHRTLTQYQEAIDFYMKAIDILKLSVSDDSFEYIFVYYELGVLYIYVHDKGSALRHFIHALDIQLSHYPPNHPTTLQLHRNISAVYPDIGKYPAAIRNVSRALEIEFTKVPREYQTIIAIYIDMAKMNIKHNTEQALIHCSQACEIVNQIFPNDHNLRGCVYKTRGLIYTEKYNRYLDMKRLKVQLARLKFNNTDTAVGGAQSGEQLFRLAMKNYKKAIKQFQLDSSDLDTELTRSNMASMYGERGSHYMRKKNYKRALQAFRREHQLEIQANPDNTELLNVLNQREIETKEYVRLHKFDLFKCFRSQSFRQRLEEDRNKLPHHCRANIPGFLEVLGHVNEFVKERDVTNPNENYENRLESVIDHLWDIPADPLLTLPKTTSVNASSVITTSDVTQPVIINEE